MSFIPKPKILHKGLKRNELGLTVHDYGGVASTLCAGCGAEGSACARAGSACAAVIASIDANAQPLPFIATPCATPCIHCISRTRL